MPLLYSAIVPHSPILITTIGKEHTLRLEATLQALKGVNQKLREFEPETIVMVAPEKEGAKDVSETFYIHAPEQYRAEFKEFGDLATKLEYTPDHFLADQIKKDLLDSGFSVMYQSEAQIEYDASVPLSHLMHGINAKVVIIHPSNGPLKTQFHFGKELQKTLQRSDKRIALIASGELSHRLTEDSPAGIWKEARSFDQQLIKSLKEKKYRKILNIKESTLQEAHICGIPSFLILLGVLEHVNCEAHLCSYEGPLGIGHLVMEYVM